MAQQHAVQGSMMGNPISGKSRVAFLRDWSFSLKKPLAKKKKKKRRGEGGTQWLKFRAFKTQSKPSRKPWEPVLASEPTELTPAGLALRSLLCSDKADRPRPPPGPGASQWAEQGGPGMAAQSPGCCGNCPGDPPPSPVKCT